MGKFWEASIELSSRMLPPDSHLDSTMVATSSVFGASVVDPTTKVFGLALVIGIDEDGIVGATKPETAEPVEKTVTQITWKDFIFLLLFLLLFAKCNAGLSKVFVGGFLLHNSVFIGTREGFLPPPLPLLHLFRRQNTLSKQNTD
jgi:hypothetical protein